MSNFESAHMRLWNRINRSKEKMVIFIRDGSLRCMRSKDAARLLQKPGITIIGYYDAACKQDWLLDDLIYADHLMKDADKWKTFKPL